jgi:hypothetical protein
MDGTNSAAIPRNNTNADVLAALSILIRHLPKTGHRFRSPPFRSCALRIQMQAVPFLLCIHRKVDPQPPPSMQTACKENACGCLLNYYLFSKIGKIVGNTKHMKAPTPIARGGNSPQAELYKVFRGDPDSSKAFEPEHHHAGVREGVFGRFTGCGLSSGHSDCLWIVLIVAVIDARRGDRLRGERLRCLKPL